jgi:pyruvate-formate lyase-activating enzyme
VIANGVRIRPRVLALITTHQCTAACDHCCFACSPKITNRIPATRLRALIDEARVVKSLEQIAFSGGECFLLGDELDALIATAKAYGYQTSCITNGYWAVNRKAARVRMRQAAASGLTAIGLSTGQMHAGFVPVERIVHGAVAAFDAGLQVSIRIEHFRGTTFDWRWIVKHPEIMELSDKDRFRVFRSNWIPHADGRGQATLRHDASLGRFRKDRISGCEEILDVVSVTPALSLIACCGYPMESIPDLVLGSVEDRTLAEVLDGTPVDFLKVLIHVKGPEFMLKFVKRFVPEYRLPTHYVGICQTCLHMHRDPIAMRVLREHAHELEAEVWPEFRELQAARPPRPRPRAARQSRLVRVRAGR